ncbi:hypothetical protein E8E11_001198 [Didymella keratinophila]|nr:hypothetical protein E8E11_001198 [Didymella keratinophila]
MTTSENNKRYPASCHCGTVRYTVTLFPPPDGPDCWVVECNCSICTRNGNLNVYVRNECIMFDAGAGLDGGGVQ